MKLIRVLKIKTLPKLLAVWMTLISISGCATIVLHPIDKVDIVSMTKGTPYTPEKDGWFLSDYYLKKVVKAKVEE